MTWLKTLTIAAALVLSTMTIADGIAPFVDRICSFKAQP